MKHHLACLSPMDDCCGQKMDYELIAVRSRQWLGPSPSVIPERTFLRRSGRIRCVPGRQYGEFIDMTTFSVAARVVKGQPLVTAIGVTFCAILALFSCVVRAQSLTVFPVSLQLVPGKRATTLTVINQGQTPTSIQVRAFAWTQPDGKDLLTTSNVILMSPPLVTIAPGAKQIIRLFLTRSAEQREETYRILLDELPHSPEQGVVAVVVRMSIPLFSAPNNPPKLHVNYRIERSAKQMYLVASNDGVLHELLRNIELFTENGSRLNTDFSGTPYILAGTVHRWPITVQDPSLLIHDTLRMNAIGAAGLSKQQLQIVDVP